MPFPALAGNPWADPEPEPLWERRRENDCPLEMNAAAFLRALRRRTRLVSNARDPLAEARRFLDAHRETAEDQAFRRVMETRASHSGKFAEPEVWLFRAETLAFVAALVEARIEGHYPELE